jgi:hypothetical protein
MSNQRRIQDADLKVTAALPNAANTVNTNAIDLQSADPFPVTESFQVRLASTTATGANNKNITIRLQESAEATANFANIATLAAVAVTDANGGGYPAATATFALPQGTKRYIRASATGEANGGNAGDGSVTVSLLF